MVNINKLHYGFLWVDSYMVRHNFLSPYMYIVNCFIALSLFVCCSNNNIHKCILGMLEIVVFKLVKFFSHWCWNFVLLYTIQEAMIKEVFPKNQLLFVVNHVHSIYFRYKTNITNMLLKILKVASINPILWQNYSSD